MWKKKKKAIETKVCTVCEGKGIIMQFGKYMKCIGCGGKGEVNG